MRAYEIVAGSVGLEGLQRCERPDPEARAGQILVRLRQGDASIPSGGIRQDRAAIFADRAAVPDLAAEGIKITS